MKKITRKIMVAMSAAVMCTVSMMNSASASAASAKKNTYKLYFDLPGNSGIRMADFVIDYNNMVFENPVIGNLGGMIDTGYVTIPDSYDEFCVVYDTKAVLTNPGTMFNVKFIADDKFDNCTVGMYTNAYDRSFSIMNNNPIDVDIVLMGDVNHDDIVNIQDTVLINRYANGTLDSIDFRAADVNEDGEVNSDDSQMILNYIVSKITNF